MRYFEKSSMLPVSADEAYAWHARPAAFERLSPPWQSIRVLDRQGDLGKGTVTLEIRLGPIRVRWVARHGDAEPGRRFVDEQVEGPFAKWRHTHLFEPGGAASCRYVDRIEYELPAGAFGSLAAGRVARELRRTFDYRHATVAADLAARARFASRGPRAFVISGMTGLIGRQLAPFLRAGGHRVQGLVRAVAGPEDIRWDPATGRLDAERLEGADAVVHLAGEPIGAGRWTQERRRRILESRRLGTALLAETLARLRRPPQVLVCASAVGIYGDRGDELLSETTPLETGPSISFVERVGHAWEAASAPAELAGIRVVRLRTGIVLSPQGGALARLLPVFRAGLGGRIGTGEQYMSWIGLDDVIGAVHHVVFTDAARGPVNATAPMPVTNAEFTSTLGTVLGRPTVLPVPAAALRAVFGAMADELLLASARVMPERLLALGYPFRHRDLEAALRHQLGRYLTA